MDKYTKAVLTVIALYVFALPVKAEEKVWYCEMTGFAQTSFRGVETFQKQKFKMKVTSEEVVFGSGGYFDEASMSMVRYGKLGFEAAHKDGNKFLILRRGEFHFSSSTAKKVTAISALCDDF
jgi:hypothetical protein